MITQNSTLKKYYRSIRRELQCPGGTKKLILSQLQQNIAAFLEESPNADLAAIHAHFGTPQQIANAYLEELSAPELSKKLQLRRKTVAIILAASISVVAIWGTAVSIALIGEISSANGYIEMYPVTVTERNEAK